MGKFNRLWIQTDLSYAATKEKLIRSGQIIGDASSDSYGKFSFVFKDFKDVTYQITTGGKLGIFYPNSVSIIQAWEKVKPYLVRPDGSAITKFDKIEDSKTLTETKLERQISIIDFALEHGIITKRDLEALSRIDFILETYPLDKNEKTLLQAVRKLLVQPLETIRKLQDEI
ncbi:MAG: hypothetical protein QXK29_03430 [Candidatus Bathyarchaeia archaeon]